MEIIKTIKITKQSIFVFVLYLLFFPLKTQFYNLIYVLFDKLLTRGEVSEIFTYNYLGLLLGCLEIQSLNESLGSKIDLYYNAVFWFLPLFSILCWILLKKRITKEQNFKYLDWVLLAVFSFALFDAIEYIVYFFQSFSYYVSDFQRQIIPIIKYTVVFLLAAYIFFKTFNKTVKREILFVVFPASIISLIVWFFYLGSSILPVIIK